jgi:integrase
MGAIGGMQVGSKASKQREEPVPGVPGLRKITYPSGKAVWYFRFDDPVTGKRGIVRLGDLNSVPYMAAVAQANALSVGIKHRRSPKSSRMTLNVNFARHYLPSAKLKKVSWPDDASRYKHHIGPVFGETALGDLTKLAIKRHIESLRQSGQLSNASCNRVLMLIRAICRQAVETEFLTVNPTDGLRATREDNARRRVLSHAEMARLFVALQAATPHLRFLALLLIYTAIRIGEALGARFSDVDEVRGILRLPRTKAGVAQEVHLSAQAQAVIADLKALRRNDYLFPAIRGEGAMHRPVKAFKKVLVQAGIDDFTFHGFRRTAATEALNCDGVTLMDVSKMLRHQSSRTTEKFYIVTSDQRLRHANESVGSRLQLRLLAGGNGPQSVTKLLPSVISRSLGKVCFVYGRRA